VESLVEFILDALESTKSGLIGIITKLIAKNGSETAALFKLACILLEIRDNTERFCSVSLNAQLKRGIRVTRGDGVDVIRSLSNVEFEKMKHQIIVFVLQNIDTELSREIAKILEKDKTDAWKKNKLDKIQVSATDSDGAYFTAMIKDKRTGVVAANDYMKSTKKHTLTSSSNCVFVFKRFSADGTETSSREVTWATSNDQLLAVTLFFSTLRNKTLVGKVSKTANTEFLAKLGDVLYESLDPSRLRKRLELLGTGAEAEDGEVEEDGADAEGYVEGIDDIDYTDGSQVRNVFRAQVEGTLDPVVFDFGEKKKGVASQSTRTRNCLATMRQVKSLFGQGYGYSFLGDHVDRNYAQSHLQLKFQIEIKSFMTCGHSPYRLGSFCSYL